MAIHHYILCVDTETKYWELDIDTEERLFPQGTVYDPDWDQWFSEYLGDGEFDPPAEIFNGMVGNVIEALNGRWDISIESLTEDQATDLVEKMKKHFNWQGALFYTGDVKDALDSHNEECEDNEKVTVEEIKNSDVWKYNMESQMVSDGFELIDEAIWQVIKKRNNK